MTRFIFLALVCSLGITSPARADDYLPVGIMATAQKSVDQAPAVGLGVELSYVRYLGKNADDGGIGLGPYLQVQMVNSDLHARGALGVQVNCYIFGLEAALAVEGSDGTRSTTFLADVAPFLSIGYASLALRVGVPIAAVDKGTPYSFQVGGVLTVKYPISLR